MTTQVKTTLTKLLTNNLNHYVQGYENMLLDEEISHEQYVHFTLYPDPLRTYLLSELKNASEIGYLEDKQENVILEAKHLNFLGKTTINEIIENIILEHLNNNN